MFSGKMKGYTANLSEHTCIVNVDKASGAFTMMMFDGAPVAKDYERESAYKATFVRGKRKVHVFVYGAKLSNDLIAKNLAAWINGEWSVTPLNAPRSGGKDKKGST